MTGEYHVLPERELVSCLNKGDERALRALYDQYIQPLYHFILRTAKSPELAKDVVQDVFAKVWELRAEVDPNQSFKAFIFTIARRHLLNLLSRMQREHGIIDEIKRYAVPVENTTERHLDWSESNALIIEAMDKLPPQRRAVFELCKIRGMSYKQAAAELGITVGTVNSQMVKALKSIQEYIELRNLIVILIVALENY